MPARQGYTAVARWTSNPAHLANPGPATGLIMIGRHPQAMIEAARRAGMPMVLMNNGLRIAPPVDFVGVDNREGGAFMAEHLASLGHRAIAYAHGEGGRFGRLERLEGLKDVYRAIPDSHIHELEFGDKEQLGFRRALGGLLAQGVRVSAFFCGSDGVAITVVSELLRLGVRIPEEVSVVGAADYACATQIAPQLTTVRVPKDELGSEAVRLVLTRAGEAQPSSSKKVLLSQTLVRRASSGPAVAPAWAARVARILAAEAARPAPPAVAESPAEVP
jgi:LacI family transcriptional regulator